MNVAQMLGQRLLYYRKMHNMTQSELAAVIGVKPEHISNVETGRKGISLEKLVLICRRFHISLSDIVPLDAHENAALRKARIKEILTVLDKLDINQLGVIKTIACSLSGD